MPEPERNKAVHNAGAFLTDTSFGMIPVPMSTLTDEYHDEPTEPEGSDRIPEPESPGLLRRLVDRIRPNPTH
jgi:hypothetical protein